MSEHSLLSFQNPQLDLAGLPAVEAVEFHKLAPAYWKYSLVRTILVFTFLLSGVAIVWVSSVQIIGVLFLLSWLLLLVFSILLLRRNYLLKGYALRAHDLIYREGVFFRRVIAFPFSRLQHCEIQEGPLERWFGLNTLNVYTAGGDSSDLAIPGLLPEEAQRLRNYILGKMGEQKEGR